VWTDGHDVGCGGVGVWAGGRSRLPPVRSMWRVAKPSTAMEMSSLSAQKRSQVSSSSSGPDEWWSARVGRTLTSVDMHEHEVLCLAL